MRAIVILSLLLTLPGALAAQEAQLQRLHESYPDHAVERIQTILAEAAASGVPSDPLLAKALEGAAKGVAADRVVAALSAYRERLEQGAGLVGPAAAPGAVVMAADALRRGVPSETIRSLATGWPDQFTVPLLVVGDLIEAGVPVGRAREIVEDALARGEDPEALLAIPAAVRRLMREGTLPEDVAALIGQAIRQGQLPSLMGPGGVLTGRPPTAVPVPPGAGPPEGAGPPKEKGQGDPPGSGLF